MCASLIVRATYFSTVYTIIFTSFLYYIYFQSIVFNWFSNQVEKVKQHCIQQLPINATF
jgi:hypothetical protein